MPLLLLAAAVLVAVLFLAVFAHRRMTESWLSRNGTRTRGQAVTVAPPLSTGLLSRLTSTVTIISFTASDGIARSLIPRSGGVTFKLAQASGAVTVLYDAAKPTSDDRMRVGFGPAPTTWHRVRLRQAA
ncbi:DUF3592 domain-containing protein [Subtercola frigoramans]|uniref:Uncharacterized protein n=1 Tax=Subtercola frigoramans TaxID=120298 RepID=A0ABS2L6P8_9MICO|nr:DUF3592 domain-containing protein [Subtercola frigoramans]MBM7472778.1 hypothetical protein [Subtercola frigoramans]